MNRTNVLFLFFLLPLAAAAQRSMTVTELTETPYDPKAGYRTWSVKGKILPWTLGNGGGVSGLLGIEYGFTKNQSIGIDVYSELEENSDDNVNDTSGVQHAIGDYWHSFERAIFFNYRYYFSFQRLREHKGIAPYLLAFVRYGKIDAAYDPLYPLNYYWKQDQRHYSAGLLLGTTFPFFTHRWCLDINTGIFDKQKVIYTQFLTHGVVSSTNWRPRDLGYRLSVNLVYWWKI